MNNKQKDKELQPTNPHFFIEKVGDSTNVQLGQIIDASNSVRFEGKWI